MLALVPARSGTSRLCVTRRPKEYIVYLLDACLKLSPEAPTGPALKKLFAAFDLETRALAMALAWLVLVQVFVALAWDAELLTRQAALFHWLVVGALPAALALWSMPDAR